MINSVVLQGRLVRDPEIKTTGAGINIADFVIAHDTGFGERKKTSYTPCVSFNKTADFVSQYFTKGKEIIIQGKLVLEQWEDKNSGEKKSRHKVEVFEVSFCGNKDDA